MARIKIKDLPEETKVSKDELKKVLGGVLVEPTAMDRILPTYSFGNLNTGNLTLSGGKIQFYPGSIW